MRTAEVADRAEARDNSGLRRKDGARLEWRVSRSLHKADPHCNRERGESGSAVEESRRSDGSHSSTTHSSIVTSSTVEGNRARVAT